MTEGCQKVAGFVDGIWVWCGEDEGHDGLCFYPSLHANPGTLISITSSNPSGAARIAKGTDSRDWIWETRRT